MPNASLRHTVPGMATKKSAAAPAYTVPGLSTDEGGRVAEVLQDRLNALQDLAMTLKHVHWNVTGPQFISVHEMLDPQVDAVRAMVDETAERIATLGTSPVGTPGALVARRSWDDYSIGRASAIEHLGALDVVYTGVIGAHREAIETVGEIDPVTEDMLIGQVGRLEMFHWFVRAHLENAAGELSTQGASTERRAATKASNRRTGKS